MKALFLLSFVMTLSFISSVEIVNAQTNPVTRLEVTTVYLVRHAERANEPTADPSLNEAGKARAQELAKTLEKAGVKSILTSQFLRRKQTFSKFRLSKFGTQAETAAITPKRKISFHILKKPN